jgi:hypothetical protein
MESARRRAARSAPLTLAYVQPIVGDENVIRLVEYRTLFGVEALF